MYLRGIGGTPCLPGVTKIAREKDRVKERNRIYDSARFEDLKDPKHLSNVNKSIINFNNAKTLYVFLNI